MEEKINKYLFEFFNGDLNKVNKWLNTENPMLGGIKPSDMILLGRGEKLLRFIKTAITEGSKQVDKNK